MTSEEETKAQDQDQSGPHKQLCWLLSVKEHLINDQGRVSLLKQLHDDLNAQRAKEEQRGIIHWQRPGHQSQGRRG